MIECICEDSCNEVKGGGNLEDLLIRKPSCLECFYMDFNDCGFNMSFHYYLKLDKKPSLEELNKALEKSLETHCGINLKFKKKAWYCSDFIAPCVIKEVDGKDLNDYKPAWLDFRKSTVALSVLHMTQCDDWYLCFDFFHGAVDGRSGVMFIYDFFAILNGKPIDKNEFSLIDHDIVKQHKNTRFRIPVWPSCEPQNWAPEKGGESNVCILKTDSCARAMAARLASAIGKCFGKNAHMLIPVDARRFLKEKGTEFFGNLILPIFVNAKATKKVKEIHNEIITRIKKEKLFSKTISKLFFYNKLPIRLRKAVLKVLIRIVMASKKFIFCALVSSIGEIKREKLQSANFNTEDIVVTFEAFPFTAFAVVSLQFNGHTNTSIGWHSGRVPTQAAESLIDGIDHCITDSE